jgi:hypothetical protein
VTLEGGDRALFLRLNKELQWPPVPEQPKVLEKTAREIAKRSQPFRTNQLGLENGFLDTSAGDAMLLSE